jgi:hypothetical protein
MDKAAFDKQSMVGSCVRLPIHIDAATMVAEMNAVPAELWGATRAPVHREANALFLRGYSPLSGIPGEGDREALEYCPYTRRLLHELLGGRPRKALLAALGPGMMIYPHRDSASDYFLGSQRIHVPVVTSEKVKFFCNGEFFTMLPGEAWSVNNLAPHAVINEDPAVTRVHLIVDVLPDAPSLDLLARGERGLGTADEVLFARLQARLKAGSQASQ